MKKTLLVSAAIMTVLFLLISCPPPERGGNPVSVTVTDMSTHYRVAIDVGDGSHYNIGKEYARKMLQVVPDWEAIVDSYIAELASNNTIFNILLVRVANIKPQIPQDYKSEIEGFASMLSGTTINAPGDNYISKDELYLINLLPDVCRATQCSAVSVFGNLSATGSTITGRILDWMTGDDNQFPRLQAVVIIQNGSRSVCLIGCLGFLGVISGCNDDGIFAAILDSPTGGVYSAADKRSYPFDLRYALEHYSTIDQVADYMTDGSKTYTFGHLIFLSDATCSKVVENDLSAGGHRSVRVYNSDLNDDVTAWTAPDYSIGAVNSFVLEGNTHNHSGIPINENRWASMISELSAAADAGSDAGTKISVNELKDVISFDGGDGPGNATNGDLYNSSTQQCIIFQPQTMDLEIYFRARNGNIADDPLFEAVDLDF